MSPPDLPQIVHDALSALPQRPSALLHAWSGGLDSTALLHALIPACQALDISLHAAHIDHQLRPSSAADAAFCLAHAASLGVSLTVHTIEVCPAGSTQAQARTARLDRLAGHARAVGAHAITTAHHQSDVIENLLLRMQRGQGSRGLSSLTRAHHPMPGHPDLVMLRPLIHLTRPQIEAWASARGLSWIEDPTNAGDDYARNQLRHHVIPALTRPQGASDGLARSITALAQEADLIEQLACDLYRHAHTPWPEPDSAALHVAPLIRAHPALLARLWQHVMCDVLGLNPLPAAHVEALTRWLLSDEHAPLQLPGALAERADALITLSAASGQGTRALDAARRPLPLALVGERGALEWYGGRLSWEGAGEEALELRGWRPGDRWAHDGDKVAESLRAAGVHPRIRWRWPLVAAAGQPRVWWAAGLARTCPGVALVWSPDD